ncbi:hypothetical protein SLEP1_g15008 [Rubroshorea leprosula]|uniref:Uncharacterized protein n=1 Tax=Rubroshorea leprosula TaxID=152421 RepID=A0AAV5IKZ6_9ROSI|nr:hypothetical protein SLEP1_g15008 [Rubroshorea leprosula]
MWVGDFWAFSEFSAIAAGSLTSQARFLQLGILVLDRPVSLVRELSARFCGVR